MNCDDADRVLVPGSAISELPLPVQEHVNSCPRCRKLAQVLTSSSPTEPPNSAILRRIEDAILSDLKPVRPMSRPASYTAILLLIFLGAAATCISLMEAYGFEEMGPRKTSIILLVLTACAASLTYSLARQMAPGAVHKLRPEILPIFIPASLAIAIALTFSFEREETFWSDSWVCLKIGLQVSLIPFLLFPLVLRNGLVLNPQLAGAGAGMLAGLVGLSALEIHCPNLDAWHILVSHLGVAVIGGLVGYSGGLLAAKSWRKPNRLLAR